MKELTVLIVGKELKTSNGQSFTAFTAMTAKGKWYKLSKVDAKELLSYKGKVATLEVSRKYTKEYDKNGVTGTADYLVVEAIKTPTEQDLNDFNSVVDAANEKTLTDL